MERTFSNPTVVEFRTEKHCNLHIEGAGSVQLYKRSGGTGWSYLTTLAGQVIDEDIVVNTPKDIRIVFVQKPSLVAVTLNEGETIDIDIQD